jgi:type IV pilus assembly protein PilV
VPGGQVEVTMTRHRAAGRQTGLTLIEVLVTIVIVAVGLLGLVGLQTRLQMAQVEAYQRAQAVMLVNDMASRISINRNYADFYVTGAPLAANGACPDLGTPPTRAEIDLAEWCDLLRGASETVGGGRVGTLVGGRGCVEDLGAGEYMVTVAWQGMAPGSPPPASVTCAANAYDGPAGTACTGDVCRRALTTIIRIANLDITP